MLINSDFNRLFITKDIFTEWESFFDWCFATASTEKLKKVKDLTLLLKENNSDCKLKAIF